MVTIIIVLVFLKEYSDYKKTQYNNEVTIPERLGL